MESPVAWLTRPWSPVSCTALGTVSSTLLGSFSCAFSGTTEAPVAWDWFVEPDMVVVVVKVRGMVLSLVVVRTVKRRRDCMLRVVQLGGRWTGYLSAYIVELVWVDLEGEVLDVRCDDDWILLESYGTVV
jgi:hypothetical protein